MKKKWIIIIFAVLAGILALVWFAAVKNPIQLKNNNQTQGSIAKQLKTTPDAEWILDPEIPADYIPVPGEDNLFMVVASDGSIKEYRQRRKAEDGSWLWETVNNDTCKTYEKVKDTDYGTVFKEKEGDFERYKRFVIDSNGGFAWVDTDDTGLDLSLPEGATLPDNYVPQVDNIYAVYNDKGVLQSFLKRSLNNGNYDWQLVGTPRAASADSLDANNPTGGTGTESNLLADFQFGDITYDDVVWSPSGNEKTTTARYRHTKEENGYTVVYETKITKKEDKDGNLLSTQKEEYEVSRTPSTGVTGNLNAVANTLDGEVQRIATRVTFNTDLANRLLDLLNADRNSVKLGSLLMDNGNLYKIAQIKAAEMAINQSAVKDSALYGTINTLATRYGVNLTNPQETVLLAMPTDANTIHTKFQSNSDVKALRMNAKSIAITVVEYNGKYYIYEAYTF